jgi:DNA-binding transcriptional MerR regulator
MAAFDDGKEQGALRTIGEVSAALGIKTHVLRYWEQQFPMLDPLKRSGGRRYYRPEDVALVREIDRLVNREGYTLRGAKAALRDGTPASTDVSPSRDTSVKSLQTPDSDLLDRLKSVRATLAAAIEA